MNLIRNIQVKRIFITLILAITVVLISGCSCGLNSASENSNNKEATNNSTTNNINNNRNKQAASLDDFKESCVKHGYEDKLEPLMSGNNKLIGYSISINSAEQPTNFIFYDVKTEENLNSIYPKEESGIIDLARKENIISDFKEDSVANYSYKKATNFKVKGNGSYADMYMPLKLAYCIKVGTTCMYAVLYENEYNDLNAVIEEIGYSVL